MLKVRLKVRLKAIFKVILIIVMQQVLYFLLPKQSLGFPRLIMPSRSKQSLLLNDIWLLDSQGRYARYAII